MIAIRNLVRKSGKKTILDNINMEIAGQTTASFLGPSGSGKTTLMRIIMGLDLPEQGTVSFDDTLLSDGNRIIIKPEKRNFSLVFQEFILFPHLNVYRNITAGLDHLPPAERKSLAEELLDLFEIAHLRQRSIDTLSGGEQQRIAIARALALKPAVLMLDEPFSNIDRKMKERLYGKLKAVIRRSGITTILATHDHAEAFFFSSRIFVLREGKIVDSNPPYTLYMQPGDPWVAGFVGETNYITGSELKTIYGMQPVPVKDNALYLIRPEEFQIVRNHNAADTGTAGAGIIEQIDFYGFYRNITVTMENGKKITVRDFHKADYTCGEKVSLKITKTPESILVTETDTAEAHQSCTNLPVQEA